MSIKRHLSAIIFMLLCLITLVGTTAWDLCVPRSIDDFNFATVAVDYQRFWDCADRDIETFGDAWQSIVAHSRHVNFRLADKLSFLFQPLGRGIEGCFLGLCMALLFYLFVRCCRPGKAVALTAAIAAPLLWYVLPWTDHFLSLDYQLNYIPSSCLVMAVMLLWRQKDSLSKAAMAAYILLCIIAGWYHEGFGVVLTAWAFGSTLFDLRSLRAWTLTAAVFAGVLINVFGGTIIRLSEFAPIINYDSISVMLSRYVFQTMPVWLALAAAVIYYIKSSHRREVLRSLVPLLLAAITGVGMAVYLTMIDRALWPAQLMALIALLRCLVPLLQGVNLRTAHALALLVAIVYALWFVRLCHYTSIIARECLTVEQKLAPRGSRMSNICFADLMPEDSIPADLSTVLYHPMHSYYDLMGVYAYYAHRRTHMVVAPAELEALPYSEWPRIQGTAGLRGIWPVVFTDNPEVTDVEFIFGPPNDDMPLFDKGLNHLRYGNADSIRVRVPNWTMPVITARYEELRWFAFVFFPRTLRHRPLLGADSYGSSPTVESIEQNH